jgi:16S rRNA (cytosine967-C5)-methyltransferase
VRVSPSRDAALSFLLAEGWEKGGDWDALLENQLSRPRLSDPRDRRLCSHLVAGTVRMRGRLDARLLRLTGRRRLDPVVQWSLRLALYQLEEMDRLPAHAVVSECVEMVKRRRGARLAGWVNAQLRLWQREGVPGSDPDPVADSETYAVERLSYPRWLARRWLRELGREKALAVMAAMNRAPDTDFRWNGMRDGLPEFLSTLAAAGAAPEHIAGLPLAFRLRGAWPDAIRPALDRGDLSVQDAAAQRVVPLLLAPGLDGPLAELCAAPGGKIAQMAELTKDSEDLYALDIDPGRLEKVVANARRLGLSRVRTEAGDLRSMTPVPAAGVLLDAPCTALGVLGSNPDARWRRSEEQIAERAGFQRKLLDAAGAWVKPGGRLVYAVCTLTPEETREQRRGFLARHGDFRHEPLAPGEAPAHCLDPEGDLMIWPGENDCAGHYATRFRRVEK